MFLAKNQPNIYMYIYGIIVENHILLKVPNGLSYFFIKTFFLSLTFFLGLLTPMIDFLGC